MKVSVQYADSHLTEVVLPARNGEDSSSRAGKMAFGDDLPVPQPMPKRGLWGAGKGEISTADDWDSAETNESIAVLFNDGPVFPGESGS